MHESATTVTESDLYCPPFLKHHRHTHTQAKAREAALADEAAACRARLAARPPRDEDVARIAALEADLRGARGALKGAEARMAALRGELLLREETYNRHFKNGGAGGRVLDVGAALAGPEALVGWMVAPQQQQQQQQHAAAATARRRRTGGDRPDRDTGGRSGSVGGGGAGALPPIGSSGSRGAMAKAASAGSSRGSSGGGDGTAAGPARPAVGR